MTTEPTAPEPFEIRTLADVDRAMEELRQLDASIAESDRLHAEVIETVNAFHDSAVKPKIDRRDQIREAIASHLQPRRRRLINKFGKEFELENGEIKWRIVPPSLMTPKDESALIQHLLDTPGGEKLLTVKYSLKRRAFPGAPRRILREVARLGARVGRQEVLSIKLKGEEDSITLRKYPYPRRKGVA